MNIRWHIRKDDKQIIAINGQSKYNEPLDTSALRKLMTSRNVFCLVAERSEVVLGFAIYTLFKDHMMLHTLTVAFDAQRQMVGSQIMQKLVEKVRRGKRKRIEMLVHESNLPLLAFLKANKFRAASVERGAFRHDETGDDGIVMSYSIHAPQAMPLSTQHAGGQ